MRWVAPLRRLAGAAVRIGAGDVEVAQRHVAEIMRRRRVGEHHFAHQLGAPVGRLGRKRRILADRRHRRRAIDRRGRGEDEAADTAGDGGRDQRPRLDRVVEVVAERIGNRFRHDDRPGEMNDRLDAVLLDQMGDQGLVAAIAVDQLRLRRDRPAEAGRQVVEDDHVLAGIDQMPDHVAADIAGAAGDQDAHAGTVPHAATLTINLSERVLTACFRHQRVILLPFRRSRSRKSR